MNKDAFTDYFIVHSSLVLGIIVFFTAYCKKIETTVSCFACSIVICSPGIFYFLLNNIIIVTNVDTYPMHVNNIQKIHITLWINDDGSNLKHFTTTPTQNDVM